jgi:Glycosyltransferase family 87
MHNRPGPPLLPPLRRILDIDRERAIAFGWVLFGVQLLVLLFLALQSYGVVGGNPHRGESTDFLMLYASGRMAASGHAPFVYDLARQSVLQQHIFGKTTLDGFFPFYYPPIYLLACAIFAPLPYLVGFAAWVLATGALFFAALRRIVGDWRLALALCSFPAAILNLALGQNAFLTAGLLGWGLLLVDRSPGLAGALFGALCFKPHFLVMVPIALLAARRWRALTGLAVSVALLTCLSALLFGIASWHAFLASLPTAEAIYGGGRLGYWAQTSLFAAVRLLGGGYILAGLIHGAATLLAAGAVAYAWGRDMPLAVRATTVIAATLIWVPINLSYDLLAVAIAVAFLCQRQTWPRLAPWERTIIMLGWLIALAGRGIAQKTGVPLMPLIAIGLLAIGVLRFAPRPRSGAATGLTPESAAR